jgi:hypothetical protein
VMKLVLKSNVRRKKFLIRCIVSSFQINTQIKGAEA